jgi:hypothetical protein
MEGHATDRAGPVKEPEGIVTGSQELPPSVEYAANAIVPLEVPPIPTATHLSPDGHTVADISLTGKVEYDQDLPPFVDRRSTLELPRAIQLPVDRQLIYDKPPRDPLPEAVGKLTDVQEKPPLVEAKATPEPVEEVPTAMQLDNDTHDNAT